MPRNSSRSCGMHRGLVLLAVNHEASSSRRSIDTCLHGRSRYTVVIKIYFSYNYNSNHFSSNTLITVGRVRFHVPLYKLYESETGYSRNGQTGTGLPVFTAQCTLVHLRGLGIACRPSVRLSVRPSVTLVICDHIGWKT